MRRLLGLCRDPQTDQFVPLDRKIKENPQLPLPLALQCHVAVARQDSQE